MKKIRRGTYTKMFKTKKLEKDLKEIKELFGFEYERSLTDYYFGYKGTPTLTVLKRIESRLNELAAVLGYRWVEKTTTEKGWKKEILPDFMFTYQEKKKRGRPKGSKNKAK